jgi:hypothetical protein
MIKVHESKNVHLHQMQHSLEDSMIDNKLILLRFRDKEVPPLKRPLLHAMKAFNRH